MSANELDPASYEFLRDYIAEQTGIELGPDRQYLVETRLHPLMEQIGCRSLAELCLALNREDQRARGNLSDVQNRVIHALSTHETSFFRDPVFFATLRSRVIPKLLETNGTGRLKFWSAAAASGQEAYSLAILAAEMAIYPPPYILATDISRIVLEDARRGTYSSYELQRGMQDESLLERYFVPRAGGAEVVPALRQNIEFRCLDLREGDPSLENYDLILCRNVLIYFEEETRQRVLDHLLAALRPGGVFVMGAAETIWAELPQVERTQVDHTTVFIKK